MSISREADRTTVNNNHRDAKKQATMRNKKPNQAYPIMKMKYRPFSLQLAGGPWIFIVTLFLATSMWAQTPAPPQDVPVAIHGATIHTITQGSIEGGTIVFRDGKITALGTEVDIPGDATLIDASGKHVYPGFIQSISTLGLMEIARIQESTDLQETGDINPNIRAHMAFHPVSEHLPVAAVHGVTTVVPLPRGSLIAGRAAAMVTDGWTWEQMTLREDLGMVIEWPSMRDASEYKEQMQLLRNAFNQARRYRKARASAAGNPGHPYDIRWEAMIPVLAGEMPVWVSAGELRQIQAAMAWAEEEELSMVLIGSRDMDLVARQLAARNIPVILRGVISGPARQWEAYSEAYKIPLRLHEAGVNFCIAGDAGAASTYRIHHHAASAAAFGLPEKEALKAITIYPARILGIDDLVGSLEVGKDATLMITDGNALELWTRKEQVFIQGRRIEMMDKHQRLYEHYLKKHEQSKP